MYRIFLNVIREGMLLGEIGGILDELHIMLQIQNQQKHVLKSFSKHVARLLRSRVPIPLDSGPETRPGHSATMDPAENNLLHVKELTENLDDHIADLTSLQETPTQVAASVSSSLLNTEVLSPLLINSSLSALLISSCSKRMSSW